MQRKEDGGADAQIEIPPSLQRLIRVASALGPLREQIVFIGGAIAPLLQTHPPFPRVRPTDDVDGVVASTSYAQANRVQEQLQELRFKQDTSGAHAHRWISPDGTPFDLVPIGEHTGGSGSKVDRLAIETAAQATRAGITFSHASAPAFLALKWAAHSDRGVPNERASHDLEDLLALIAARPTIVGEVENSPQELRNYVGSQAQQLLSNPDCDELLDGHLNNAYDRRAVVNQVRQSLRAFALFTERA